jgi:hypothetical protein
MFWRWKRLGALNRSRVWKHYGWFSGLMCLGCILGAVAQPAWAAFLVNYYTSERPNFTNSTVRGGPEDTEAMLSYAKVSLAESAAALSRARSRCAVSYGIIDFMSQALRWLAVYAMTYPVTLCCVSVAKLLVLGRLAHFAKVSSRWAFCLRLLVGFVVIGNVIALCSSIAASVYFARSIDAFESGVRTGDIEQSRDDGVLYLGQGTRASSVLVAFEAITLLLCVIAFSVVGILSMSLINNALRQAELAHSLVAHNKHVVQGPTNDAVLNDAVYTGRQLKRQILSTCGVAFVSFLIRACFSVFFALTNALQQSSIACPNFTDRCSDCYNVFSHMLIWYLYSPDVVLSVVLVSQPVTVLVMLWGMTTGRTFGILKAGIA